MKRIVLTGAPGSGKTSVINNLNNKGFQVYEEQARIHIQKALDLNTDIVPWGDHLQFSKNVAASQLLQFKSQNHSIAFYDRGILDGLAYLRHSEIIPPPNLMEYYKNIEYHKDVFYFKHWSEIHENDETRREPEEDVILIQEEIKKTYQEFGYNIIEVPKTTVDLRVEFILKQIGEYSST
jgi:predicted ATPase